VAVTAGVKLSLLFWRNFFAKMPPLYTATAKRSCLLRLFAAPQCGANQKAKALRQQAPKRPAAHRQQKPPVLKIVGSRAKPAPNRSNG